MSTSVDHLQELTQDASDLLTDIVPSAITLATMLRHRKMAAWLREEFDGYTDKDKAPPYRRDLPGHIVAKSPQYGWIPAPVDERQTAEYGHLDLPEGIKSLEQVCLNCKKGNGHRALLDKDDMAHVQKQINLKAELAINLSREVYCRLLRTIRSASELVSMASPSMANLGRMADSICAIRLIQYQNAQSHCCLLTTTQHHRRSR